MALSTMFRRRNRKQSSSSQTGISAKGNNTSKEIPTTSADDAAFTCEIPDTVGPGDVFSVTARGQIIHLKCPANARPGQRVNFRVPILPRQMPAQEIEVPALSPPPPPPPLQEEPSEKLLRFEVLVPKGVVPGKPFALMANGVRVLVTCPAEAHPGQKIQFKVPASLVQKQNVTNPLAKIRLKYNNKKDGWTRDVRLVDQKFQWVHIDESGGVSSDRVLDIDKRAFCRILKHGKVTLVPAGEALVDSKVRLTKNNNEKVLVSYQDIASVQVKRFGEKTKWFQSTCDKLRIPFEEGHMQVNVRRNYIVQDSMGAIMGMTREDLRKIWRFHFIEEEGVEAGGLTRDWFQNITEKLFDPQHGLFVSSVGNQMCMDINPNSEVACGTDHLQYYRFLGRVMGRALLDRQLMAGHMVEYLYKHLLGFPITVADLKSVDEEFYSGLRKLKDMVEAGDDISMLCLDFTITRDVMGDQQEVELVPGGSDIEVGNANFEDYIEACLKDKTLTKVNDQLGHLLQGFFDVIPEPLLAVFDFQELELLMCGLPEIDIEDWQANTEYTGKYAYGNEYAEYGNEQNNNSACCQWFWEVVAEYDHEIRARLLQFVTGTGGVPSRGFSALQGNDGNIRKFTIEGVDRKTYAYPRSHTCFNRIDLPVYTSKSELREKLTEAIAGYATVGFGFE